MSEYGFRNDGWYPHDGEGKGMCTGPGCNCDERNYGHRHSAGSSDIGDGILVILAVVFGMFFPPIGLIFALIFMSK
jgi:hypothetical protein